jgi:hypothetical protein
MTEYVLGNGRGAAGVQPKKEGLIIEDETPLNLDSILDRIAPEKREAFLKSRAKLMDKGDAELLSIVLHLDNFAAVIDGLTIGLSPRSENARDIDTARKEVQALRSAGDGLKRADCALQSAR